MFKRIHKVIGSKDYINLKLTGRTLTDFSYASGSGVYDLPGWKYDDALIRATGLPTGFSPRSRLQPRLLGLFARRRPRSWDSPVREGSVRRSGQLLHGPGSAEHT